MPQQNYCALVRHVLVAMFLGAFAATQAPTGGVRFNVQRWGIAEGLPQGTATAILQSSKHFLYVGTSGGLCRFAGQNLLVLDTVSAPGLPSNRISTLLEGQDGTLYVGTEGRGITTFRDGVATWLPELRARTITALAELADGRICVGANRGVFVREAGGIRQIKGNFGQIAAMHPLPNGDVLIAATHGLFALRGGAVEQLAERSCHAFAHVQGRLLVSVDKRIAMLDSGVLRELDIQAELGHVHALLASRDGPVWLACANGVRWLRASDVEAAIAGKQVTPFSIPGLPDDNVLSLTEDHEGGLWAGYHRHGLVRLRPSELISFGEQEGIPEGNPNTVILDGEGRLLVTVGKKVLRNNELGRFEPLLEAERPVRLLHRDSQGTVWATQRRQLCKLVGNELQAIPAGDQSLGLIRTMVELPDGTLWVFSSHGIASLQGEQWGPVHAFDGQKLGAIKHAAVAADGAVWVGGPVMLARFDPTSGHVRIWRCGQELPFGAVRGILPAVGENAWIASYGGGIVRMQSGVCSAIDEPHGLLDQSLCAMIPFGDSFFVAANRGCFVVTRTALEAVSDGRATTIGCRSLSCDGDQVAECNGGWSKCLELAGDRIWVCGVNSIFQFMPGCSEPSSRPLHVFAARVFVGDQRVNQFGAIAPEVGVRNASIELGACAFETPDRVRFRHRVLGHRDQWSAPSYEREVRLEGLPAGDLVFEAEAIDVDGMRSAKPLQIALHLPAHVWEKSWFLVATPIALAMLLVLLIRLFSGRATRRAQVLQRSVEERTRELRSARDQLESRVTERTHELRQAIARQADDMETRQQLEREVHELRRMESIGQLAGGIAHDFNNLLTVTLSSGQLLEHDAQDEESAELCRNIILASTRGRALTQHLLAIASRQIVTTAALDMRKVVADLRPVLTTLVGDDVALHCAIEGPLIHVRGSVTQVEQVLINLAANARDAMPEGGTVRIRVTSSGDTARLSVEDEGEGMPAEVVAQAFEPFFTTKQHSGLGRGLGLATVHGIVKQLGGEIEIRSKLGAGTTIVVTLPTTDEPATIVDAPPPAPGRLSGSVLLIEDEPAVREVTRRLIERLGCRVVTAKDGDDAVAQLRAGEAVDVVLSDVVMPGLQGRALVDALRQVDPGLQVAFSTGYLDRRRAHEDVLDLGFDVLTKPVDAAQLGTTLNRLLAARRAGRS